MNFLHSPCFLTDVDRYGFEYISETTERIMKTSLIFLLGIGMGTVLGILIAPEAGKITRRKIRDEADRIIDQTLQKKRQQAELNRLVATPEPADAAVITETRYTI